MLKLISGKNIQNGLLNTRLMRFFSENAEEINDLDLNELEDIDEPAPITKTATISPVVIKKNVYVRPPKPQNRIKS